MYIRKKTFILIITYLTAAVIALGTYTAVHFGMEGSYRRTAEYGYAHAFEEVVYAASNLSDALHRASYATGAELSGELCADIYGSCLAAEMTMAALPFSTQELEQTAAFIGIAGDYARGLLRSSAQSGFDDAARRNFAALHKTADSITRSLYELRDAVNDGDVLMDEPENVFAGDGDRLSTALLGMEGKMSPTELDSYDGRYSDTAPDAGAEPISQDEAKAAAADFFGLDPEELETEYSAENGTVCFAFDGGSICVDAEGRVLSLSSGRSVAGDMESSELEKAARDFLASHGFGDMYLASESRNGSVLTMKFECIENGIRCINDSVRISVAGDYGDIYAFDATEHVKNHGTYPEAAQTVGESAARAALPAALGVNSSQLCYAPTEGKSAVLCYGFDCTGSDGERLFVLVDAQTGRQFDIEIL